MVAKHENVKWVDGLRGLASVSVVVTHLCRAFDPQLFYPNTQPPHENPNAVSRPLQWPIIRVFFQGRIGIAIFALVTGYVCALKPIRMSKAGNIEGALVSVAKSAFRRIPRLFLPTMFATFIIFVMTQMHFFQVARNASSEWLIITSPTLYNTWGEAITALFRESMFTWTKHMNNFDPNQWTLQPLLKGSMLIYMLLFGTIYCKQEWRMFFSLCFFVYYYLAGEVTFNMQFFFGMFLSDLSNHTAACAWINSKAWIRRFVPPIFMIIGLYIASYPEANVDWTAWSAQMARWGEKVCFLGQDPARLFTGIGMDFICMAIFFSPWLKDALSSKHLLWLGKHSFAVYLLHGTLIRSILSWAMFGMHTPGFHEEEREGKLVMVSNGRLPMRPKYHLAWIMPPFFVGLYTIAFFWTKYVDPYCAKLTFKFEKFVFKENEKSSGNGLLLQPVGGQ